MHLLWNTLPFGWAQKFKSMKCCVAYSNWLQSSTTQGLMCVYNVYATAVVEPELEKVNRLKVWSRVVNDCMNEHLQTCMYLIESGFKWWWLVGAFNLMFLSYSMPTDWALFVAHCIPLSLSMTLAVSIPLSFCAHSIIFNNFSAQLKQQ